MKIQNKRDGDTLASATKKRLSVLAPVVESASVFFEIRFHFLNVRVYALENTLLYVFEISASCI